MLWVKDRNSIDSVSELGSQSDTDVCSRIHKPSAGTRRTRLVKVILVSIPLPEILRENIVIGMDSIV